MNEDRIYFALRKDHYEAIKDLDNENFSMVFRAICDYSFYEKEPDISNWNDTCKMAWRMVFQVLKNGWAQFRNGSKGGRPKTKPKIGVGEKIENGERLYYYGGMWKPVPMDAPPREKRSQFWEEAGYRWNVEPY